MSRMRTIPIHVIRVHKNFYENCCKLVFRGLSLIRWRHCTGLDAENYHAWSDG